MGKIDLGSGLRWFNRLQEMPQSIIYTSPCRAHNRLVYEGKMFSKYRKTAKTQGDPTPPLPTPLYHGGGVTLLVCPRVMYNSLISNVIQFFKQLQITTSMQCSIDEHLMNASMQPSIHQHLMNYWPKQVPWILDSVVLLLFWALLLSCSSLVFLNFRKTRKMWQRQVNQTMAYTHWHQRPLTNMWKWACIL